MLQFWSFPVKVFNYYSRTGKISFVLLEDCLIVLVALLKFQRHPQEVFQMSRSSHQRCSIKEVFLKISKIYRPSTLLKKTLAQVFSCEFCGILRTPFLTEHLKTAASRCLIFSRSLWYIYVFKVEPTLYFRLILEV